MTEPLPPGWHPDPEGSPQLRWWDGTQWTSQTHEPPKKKMPWWKALTIGAAGVAALWILVAVILNATGETDRTRANNAAESAAQSTVEAASTPASSPRPEPSPTPTASVSAVPATTIAAPAVATTTEAPAPETTEPTSDPLTPEQVSDLTYIAVLDMNHVQYTSKDGAIDVAHKICTAMDGGASFEQVGLSIVNTGAYGYADAGTIVGAATSAYCPDNQLGSH